MIPAIHMREAPFFPHRIEDLARRTLTDEEERNGPPQPAPQSHLFRTSHAAPGAQHLFRNIFERNTRDHALLVYTDADTPGSPHRVSVDDWQIEACPHHGPSLAVARPDIIHAAWFTAGNARQGLFYARSLDGGLHFTAPMPIGDPARRPARPYLLASGHTVRLVWKEFDGEVTVVKQMTSTDDGASWSAPSELESTSDASDHPLLVSAGGHSFLSWMTRAEGYRLPSPRRISRSIMSANAAGSG
jgi:hypothetical protein